MIELKNKTDIKYIKRAIVIGEHILSRMARYMKPGVTPKQLNKKIEFLIWLNRATPSFKGYQGFPSASCISINKTIIHGVPNDVPLKNGDIVKIDLGIEYKKYISDQSRTYFVGELLKNVEDFRLVYATKLALDRAKKVAIIGNTVGDISKAIEDTAKEFGLGILRDYAGHGTGYEIHEPPRIPNRVGLDRDVKLVKGLILAIEPMMVLGKGNYTIAENGFDVIADGRSAHFEATVVIG